MSNIKVVPYSWQQDANSCGLACIEMLLRYYGLIESIANSKEIQTAIAELERIVRGSIANGDFKPGNWQDWVTTPVELINIIRKIADTKELKTLSNQSVLSPGESEKLAELNHLGLNYFNSKSEDDGDLNAANFMEKLTTYLNDSNHPPLIVPIHEASHWVVLHGIEGNGNNIKFVGKDPWQGFEYSKKQTGSSKTQNASPPDGTIRIARKKRNFNGKENQLIVMLTQGGLDINSRLGKPRSMEGTPTPGSPVDQPPRKSSPPPIQPVRLDSAAAPVGRIVPPTASLPNIIKQEMIDYGFCTSSEAETFMQSLTPPVLVTHTNQPNSDYYLVMQKNSIGETVQIFRFEATPGSEYGKFLDALQTQPTQLSLDIKLDPTALRPGTIGIARSAAPSPVVKAETLGNPPPNLLWQPCREAQSPFFPFYEVIENNKRSYKGTDGFRFKQITTTAVAVKNDPSSQSTT